MWRERTEATREINLFIGLVPVLGVVEGCENLPVTVAFITFALIP